MNPVLWRTPLLHLRTEQFTLTIGTCFLILEMFSSSSPLVLPLYPFVFVRKIYIAVLHYSCSEGAGGGHAPDIIKVCGVKNVLPSSTNPTRPYTLNTVDEHLDMLVREDNEICLYINNPLLEKMM